LNTANNKKNNSLRADAAQVLFKILEQGMSSRECLAEAQKVHSDQDKAWLQEMVYGVLRQLPLLQYWLRLLLDKPLKNRFKVVEHIILLGFYQLAFSRVSTHAAVSETVDACQSVNAVAMKGLVNAILRNFIRQETALIRPDDQQINSGLPKWLYKKLANQYPLQLDDLVTAMQQKPPLWLRINCLKITKADYMEALRGAEIDFSESERHSHAVILDRGCDITSLPGYHQGWFAVQDGAPQLAAKLLNPQVGERILDCCAAPGGKTCHLLEVQPNIEQCVALDIDQQRLERVSENLLRLDHKADLLSGDASKPELWWDGRQFDRILLDAPCSATGVIRRHPDIKWLRKSADIEVLVDLQKQILTAIWPLLKPGGTLLYATCSILAEENQQQICNFLQQYADAELSPIAECETSELPGLQILPGEGQMDGFYYARLLKSV
jgi:16S rRNA (cytosine967-C5)-methyltransferase